MCAALTVWGQAPAPPQTTPPGPQPGAVTIKTPGSSSTSDASQQVERTPKYVRTFSAGLSLNWLGLTSIKNGSYSSTQTSPPVSTTASTTGGSERFGGGVQVQFAFLDHYAVNVGLIYRQASYALSMDTYEGVDIISTPQDERKLTSVDERTRVIYYDLPVLVRYYWQRHDEKGPRWFFEGGGTMRTTRNIRTSRSTILPDGTIVADSNQAVPTNKKIYGATTGVGAQFIDPFGIRVVPEFRYTRWLGYTWNNLSTVSQRNQIEAVLSITF